MLDRPIFLFGVPRSGTSFIYESFSKHETLGWVSNYQNRLPGLPIVSTINRLFDNSLVYKMGSRKRSNKMTSIKISFPKPTEPYILWDKLSGVNFSMDFLLGQKVKKGAKTELVSLHKKILHLQGKKRLVNKFTGPSRLEFIKSVFPNALFIHIVRDGRAVVQSLLNVDFWKNGGGYDKIWWQNGKPSTDLKKWEHRLEEPKMLAAFQYRNIMEKTYQESQSIDKANYLEIKYEDFLLEPKSYLEKMYRFCDLDLNSRSFEMISKTNIDPYLKYKTAFEKSEIEELSQLLKPILLRYNYTL